LLMSTAATLLVGQSAYEQVISEHCLRQLLRNERLGSALSQAATPPSSGHICVRPSMANLAPQL
jgi:hypothetical protein